MNQYGNIIRSSGVESYKIENDLIAIKFVNISTVYIYSYIKPGQIKVEKMKSLARQGRGLTTYISKNVKKNYERKID